MSKSLAVLILFFTICGLCSAQNTEIADSAFLYGNLDEVVLTYKVKPAAIRQVKGDVTMSLDEIENLPNFLGTADPLNYLRSVAGVQMNNEATAGLYIQGCADYQSVLTLNGAPVYYPNHLLGLFSGFISDHFETITLQKSAHDASFQNRLGGGIWLYTKKSATEKFKISGNVGLISSDLTMEIPCGQKSAFLISGRATYINLLYNKLLTIDDIALRYGFQDYNLTYSIFPSEKDTILCTAYFGRDKLSSEFTKSDVEAKLPWYNIAASVDWNHRFQDKGNIHTTAFYSGYENKLNVASQSVEANELANLASWGLKSHVEYKVLPQLALKGGAEWNMHITTPCLFDISENEIKSTSRDVKRQKKHETSFFLQVEHNVSAHFSYDLGIHSSFFSGEKQMFWGVDPRINLNFRINKSNMIYAHYGMYHQYLHKIALLNGGLPCDFWILASKNAKPELAHAVSLGYNLDIIDGKYSFSAEAYFKQLYNAQEFYGNVFELINTDFDYERMIIQGNGRNYGLNIMFNKNKGFVKGYISYALGWSMRQFAELGGGYDYSASYDRRHDLKIVLNSQVASRWSLGLMFTLMSGTPYTPPKYAYILNGKIACEYAALNSANLPLYHRLDLTANYWIIKDDRGELGLNLSLYNVYCHKNILFTVLDDKFKMRQISMLKYVIPSLSLFFKF